jgi:hypothetical protein
MITAGRAKDVGSQSVTVPQGNNNISFKKRVRDECTPSGFFNVAGRQSQCLRSQAGPLRKRTVNGLQVAFGNVDVRGKHRKIECCRTGVNWYRFVSTIKRLPLGTVSCGSTSSRDTGCKVSLARFISLLEHVNSYARLIKNILSLRRL